MSAPKAIVKNKPAFFLVDPDELEGLDEWAEWLCALLNGPCSVAERDGKLILIEIRRLVAVVDDHLRIEVRSDEHPPPHFHVKSLDIDASFSIEDCKLIRGSISGKDHRTIRYWHERAKSQLADAWNAARPGDCPVGEFRRA